MKSNKISSSIGLIIYPGETIKELLEENNMVLEELAERMNFCTEYVSEVIDGKKRITTKFAMELEKIFGISCRFWLNLQANHDKETSCN